MREHRLLIVAAAIAVAAGALHAQHAFDVVSIKENADASSTGGSLQLMRGEGIRAVHMRAQNLITIAYHLQQYQLVDAPDWTAGTFYNVQARTSTPATRDGLFEMMQAMLVDRFRLAFHREPRELDGFALVSTGKAGPNLRESALDCEKTFEARCREGRISADSLKGVGGHLWTLVQVVTGAVSAPVIDDTHLTGAYDIDLHWTNDLTTASDEPSIYTALQDQLGLKLERRKVPVDMFIVDRIERPSPD